jgi:uncharacterized coiled-coil protein SlyX
MAVGKAYGRADGVGIKAEPMEHETPLEQAQRHVAEGEERVAHQERIVADLSEHGAREEIIGNSIKMLGELRRMLVLAHEHVQFLLRNQGSRGRNSGHSGAG